MTARALRFEGYVIVSREGCLADARHMMPDRLKFDADAAFFSSGLDRAALIVHGRNSYEDQPNSPRRRRVVLTHRVDAVAPDPSEPNWTLWNPAGASFAQACDAAGVHAGTIAVIGGPAVFAMFFGQYDTFWLSQAHRVHLPDGIGAFPGVPEQSAQAVLAASGLKAGERRVLDAVHDVDVTAWVRPPHDKTG